jgi:anti-sigma factor RsiW
MSCASIDLKDYFFGETSPAERHRAEQHLQDCAGCREELSRLQLTHAALGSLRDEELPRRIAFVSDQVFEPRWYQRLWRSGPHLGFVAASLLAAAILVHAFVRPAPVVTTASAPASISVDPAAIDRAVAARIGEAVNKAVAESEARQQKKTTELLQASERKYELDRRATIEAISAQSSYIQKALNRDYALANNLGSGQ